VRVAVLVLSHAGCLLLDYEAVEMVIPVVRWVLVRYQLTQRLPP
jgi:hypothetical protein